jgi:hypothetical protein
MRATWVAFRSFDLTVHGSHTLALPLVKKWGGIPRLALIDRLVL